MSKECIEREAILIKLSRMIDYCKKDQKITGLTTLFQVGDAIMDCPAADVAPVRHGVWEYEPPTINTYGMLKCSKCGWWTLDQSVCDVYHYCPNCGARMLEDE